MKRYRYHKIVEKKASEEGDEKKGEKKGHQKRYPSTIKNKKKISTYKRQKNEKGQKKYLTPILDDAIIFHVNASNPNADPIRT